MKAPHYRMVRGFTLIEVMVTIALLTIVGGLIYLVLNSGMVLYAKNTAVNSAHQQARVGVDQMLARIHSAVSIPELVNQSGTQFQALSSLVDGAGKPVKASGVAFQVFSAGPFPVVSSAAANATSLTLYCPGLTPLSNPRVNIPSHNIELDVISTSASGGNRTFNFATPIGTAVTISGNGLEGGANVQYVITAFLTTRGAYAVIGSELRYYPDANVADVTASSAYRVVTRGIDSSSAAPFSIPVMPNGGLQNRYVAAIDLAAVEPSVTNRGYAAVNMFISSLIPFRTRLTNTQ